MSEYVKEVKEKEINHPRVNPYPNLWKLGPVAKTKRLARENTITSLLSLEGHLELTFHPEVQ